MRIENIPNILPKERFHVKNNAVSTPSNNGDTYQTRLSGREIPFGAIYGVKPPKSILDKKMQILQKIETMLSERKKYSHDVVSREVREKYEKELNRFVKKALHSDYSKQDLMDEFQNNPLLQYNIQGFALNLLFRHIEELIPKIQKITDETEKITKERASADKTDYELLGRLHSTLISDDLNLTAAYQKYYGKLSSMTKLSEVHRAYPRINLPPSPQNIAGKKIVNTLPKDVFLKYEELIESGSKDEANQLLNATFETLIKEIAKDSKSDVDFLRTKLLKGTRKAFLSTYHSVKKAHGFASYPEQRKIKHPIISKTDIDLLSIDYDRFVLDVLKKQYLEGKKLSEIKYTEGQLTISPNSLPQEYKFDKPDQKIRTLLKLSEELRKEETNYDNFSNEQFRSRLKHFFNHEIVNSEVVLNRLIEFDSAQFVEGDRLPLIKFLRVLDDLCDNKISIEDAEKIIEKENLRPLGTDSINAAEKEKNLQLLKEEQRKLNEFNKYCKKYDNAIEILFRENLEEVATLCISYKPKTLEESREISDKILKTISENIKDDKIPEPERLAKTLKNMYTFYHNKTFYPDRPQFKKALQFGTMPDGMVNEAKVGQYLTCSELVEKYPASSGFYTGNDNKIFTTIMQKSKNNESAILNLIKFEDYKMLNEKEKLQISTILKHFDINSAEEKEIIQTLVENVYIKTPTHITTALNKEGSLTTESVMTPSAKEAIIKDKPYPICLKYFETFEKSMTRIGPSKEEDGIQVIGTNNKVLRKYYKQEVKIPMEERLYSTQGDYVFDVYRSGLHRQKFSKA